MVLAPQKYTELSGGDWPFPAGRGIGRMPCGGLFPAAYFPIP